VIEFDEAADQSGPQTVAPRIASLPRVLGAIAAPRTTATAIDRLIAEHGVPLAAGGTYTFVWRGDADAVALEHRVMGLPRPVPLRRVRGTDRWHATLALPRGSRVEYRFLVRRGAAIESLDDPLNHRRSRDPWGSASVLEAEGYETPPWAVHDPAVAQGSLVEVKIDSRSLAREARITLYLPARLRPGDELPLLVLHDGGDYLEYAGMRTVLDNLMHRRAVADCMVAFTYPHDRLVEYAAGAAHSAFLNSELIPELERTLPVQRRPQARFLGGASLGAIASLAAALESPHFYGGLFLQSASLFASALERDQRAGPAVRPVARFTTALSAKPRLITDRIFQSVGAFEPLAARNRAMRGVMDRLATETGYVEGLDGHNWTSWRDRMLDGLAWLLPGDAAPV